MISLELISRTIQATLSELRISVSGYCKRYIFKFFRQFCDFLIEFQAYFAIFPNCAMIYEPITYIHSSEVKSY